MRARALDLTPEDIARRIAAGEGKHLELKRGLPRDEKIARTLAAFANTRGGLLLVGVGDRGEIVGAPRPPACIARLRAIAAGTLEPALEVELGIVTVEGRRIVWCSVPISPSRPHAVPSTAGAGREVLVRAGSRNRVASAAELGRIRSERAAGATIGATTDALEAAVLDWVARRMDGARDPAGHATAAAFAEEHGIGRQRARRTFAALELAGRLVGHGADARRVYRLPGGGPAG